MSDLIIYKQSESYIRIECDSGIGMELSEYFSFMVPGAQFMPKVRNKLWDGRIRLFDTRTHLIYAGLIGNIQKFAKDREYTIDYDDYVKEMFSIDTIDIEKFITEENIVLTAHNNKINIRDYQINGINHALNYKRAVIQSSTGSGKSLMIYLMIRYFLHTFPEQKVLLVVPTTQLVSQMYTDFNDYSSQDTGFNTEKECHQIYSGKEKTDKSARIIISTWQSIFKLHKNWFDIFGMVIGDECHGFKAKSLTSIMEKATNASYRIGTTGTVNSENVHKLILTGVFGPIFKAVSTKELMDSDTLAQLKINVINLGYNDLDRKENKGNTYQKEIDFLVSHEKRNRFIRNLALDQTGNTLVLFNYVEKHGIPLYELISEKADKSKKVHFVSGSVKATDRENIRNIVEKSENDIIVASLGVFSTGVNLRNLNNIIFASPSKSQIRVLQSIGRGLRKAENNRDTVLFDICDDLQWKSKRNYTLDHGKERIKIYLNEKFDFKIHKVNLT